MRGPRAAGCGGQGPEGSSLLMMLEVCSNVRVDDLEYLTSSPFWYSCSSETVAKTFLHNSLLVVPAKA